MTIQEFYDKAILNPPFDLPNNPIGFKGVSSVNKSDISAHLPLLKYFASQCNHITEFGMREGNSTAAFIMGLNSVHKKLVSYDFMRHKIHHMGIFQNLPCQWEFRQMDIVSPGWEIDYTDFLFVDDLHTYAQVRDELKQHGHKVKTYLGFHDTWSQGVTSLDRGGEEGIVRAIEEYTYNKFTLIYETLFNHGLRIYKRN